MILSRFADDTGHRLPDVRTAVQHSRRNFQCQIRPPDKGPPVVTAGLELPQLGQQGGAPEPEIGVPRPPVKNAVHPNPTQDILSGHQWPDHVNRERIDQFRQIGVPHETFQAGQVCGFEERDM